MGSKTATLVVVGLVLLRLSYMAAPDLFPEEAYYWNYSRHLDIGYLDHPPMVAWLIRLGTALFGDTEFGVRIFALCSALVTAAATFGLTELLYDRRSAVVAVLVVQVLPFFFMTGWMMTPDAPLTACWAGALYFLARVFFERNARAWMGVGACLGLGLLSKYTIALLGPAALLFLALDPASRIWFRRTAPYFGVLLAVVIFSPVLVWNASHHWASFAFQSTGRVAEPARFSLHELAAAVLLLLTPVGAILAAKSLFGAASQEHARRRLFAQVFTLAPLAVFFLFSLVHRVKLNWTGPLWLAVVPAIAAQLTGFRRAWAITVALLCVAYFALLQYLAFGLPGLGYARSIELLPVGWSELGRALDREKSEVQRSAPGRVLVVGLDRNFIASEAAFYQPDHAAAVRETTGAHLFGSRSLMYGFWFPPREQAGATLLLVSFNKGDLHKRQIREHCARVGPIEEHWLERDGKKIRPYYTAVARAYRP